MPRIEVHRDHFQVTEHELNIWVNQVEEAKEKNPSISS